MKSLFTPLKEKGLTSLKIQHDMKTGAVRMQAAKEWDSDIDFSSYNKAFYAESILSDDAVFLNTKQVVEMYGDAGLGGYLSEVVGLIKKGGHFGIEAYYYDKYDMRFISNQHNREMGIHNTRRAIFSGGMRRHELDKPEIEVISDGLNLSRAMSFKNIAAGIRYGGAKTVVHMDPPDMNNMDQLGFLAYAIDKCRATASPDMRMPKDMAAVMRDNFSLQWLSGPGSPLGPSGIPTAHGVFHAIKQALKFKTGSDSFKGVSAAVQGLGEVGMLVAELLAGEGAELIITNRNMAKAGELIKKYPENKITVVPEDEILYVSADIFSPNAVGGVITEENIPDLKFKIIIGGANNQLRASDIEDEIRLAKLLDKRGILFQVDFWHNCGGVIVAFDEYELGTNTTVEAVIEKVAARVSKNTREKLAEAKARGVTPTVAIYEECFKALNS